MHYQLSTYPSIAWDFDKTLINNPHAAKFWRIIKRNPNIKHYIVTFRSHGMQRVIPVQLAECYNAPDINHFYKILNIDDAMYTAYTNALNKRLLTEQQTGLPVTITPDEINYYNWKGLVCKNNNIPVLVDDAISSVKPGCQRYGIRLFNSQNLRWEI